MQYSAESARRMAGEHQNIRTGNVTGGIVGASISVSGTGHSFGNTSITDDTITSHSHNVYHAPVDMGRQHYAKARVLLLGKTGSGKSSLGNTLLGRNVFRVGGPMQSMTQTCQIESNEELEVMDTPGLFAPNRHSSRMEKELQKAGDFLRHAPGVVLFVVRCDRRFVQEESDVYLHLKGRFGNDICRHMIVVFNGLDSRGETLDEQRQSLEEDIHDPPLLMKPLLSDVGNRYIGFNNKAAASEKEQLKKDLISMIKELLDSKNPAAGSSPSNLMRFTKAAKADVEKTTRPELSPLQVK